MTGAGDHRDRPPRLASAVLSAALPSDLRGRSIMGDLLEEWHERAPGARRTLWYWGECARVSARYLFVARRLPGVPAVSEKRRVGRWRLSSLPLDDLRDGLRGAVRAPVASALTILALGLGIAAPTIMYSLMVGVTRDLPVPDPQALVHVGRRFTPSIIRGADPDWLRPLLEDPHAGADGALEHVGAFGLGRFDISGEEGFPERRRGARVTPGVFETLGVQPALGRAFDRRDGNGGEPTVMISDALWRERFGAGSHVLGRRVRIDGAPHTVIGVMPPGFGFPDEAQLWLPLDPTGAEAPGSVELVGRLADGGSVDGLQTRVAAVMSGLQETGVVSPDVRGGLAAEPWSHRSIDESARRMLRIMVLLVSFVLVIACADVAHLFLARALAQRRETAVRVALGAARWRVIRQHLAESVVLAAAGGLLALAVSAVGVRALAAGMAPRLGWWMEIRLDLAVLAFSTVLVALSALVTGLVPALISTRVDVSSLLRDGGRAQAGGRRTFRLMGGLVAAEVALTCTLLVVAGLLTRGAIRNLETDGNFATSTLLAADYEVGSDRDLDDGALMTFHSELATRMAARPGVAAAGLASHLPGVFSASDAVEVEDAIYPRPEDRPTTHVVHVSPGFLDAMNVAPVRGRDLTWSDGRDEALAALVNEAFVRRYLGDRDALGARVRVAPDPPAGGGAADSAGEAAGEAGTAEDGAGEARRPGATDGWATIVGIVPSLGLAVGRDRDDTGIYLPFAAGPPRTAYLLVRAGAGATPSGLAPAARTVAAGLDPDLALSNMNTLEDRMRATRDMETLFATLVGFFGITGLVLTGVGLYGLMAFTTGRRVRELGIRSALGARAGTVVWTAVRGGALQVGAGLVVGLAIAALVAPFLGDFFMGYDPRDTVAYAAVALVLLTTGLAATLVPARRALSVDVAEVLRAE